MSNGKKSHLSDLSTLGEGPFTFSQISRRLARLPGRLEVDEEEAYRILFAFIRLYEGDYFGDDEVVALYGNPPRFRPLKSLPKKAQQLEPTDWRDGAVWLTAPALLRYLERSTLHGAPRLLAELFGERSTKPNIAGPSAPPTSQASGSASRGIPKNTLTKYMRTIKERGGSAPAADGLLPEIRDEFPNYHVTRQDVRTVHRDVFGQLRPGKRPK